MRFFLRTRRFKICVAILCVVLVGSIIVRAVTGVFSPGSGLLGMLISPFEQAVTAISGAVEDLNQKLNDGDELLLKNKQLEEELADLRGKTADLDETKRQNDFYKNYLEIKENNPDYCFCDAKLIARDSDDPYKSFVLNKGSANDIKQYDPVLVNNYLIGYVGEVGITTCKVVTLLNPEITLGANDSRTDDPGVVTGSADLAAEGKIKLYRLSRSCSVAVGDYIVSSGEGVFPAGLLIGTVDNIKNDDYSSSLFASVVPFSDYDSLRNVMILTSFNGQGTMMDAGE